MKVSAFLSALLLVLGSASVGRAFTISFNESDAEDVPVIATTDIPNAVVTTDVEKATVVANVPGVPFPATPNIKLFSDILLTEADGTPSDYMSVFIDPLPATPGLGLQSTITVTFLSDTPGGTLPSPVVPQSVVETGEPQLVFGLSTADAAGAVFPLEITARSELTEVPEPTALFLLGSGLAGLAAFGRRRLIWRAQHPKKSSLATAGLVDGPSGLRLERRANETHDVLSAVRSGAGHDAGVHDCPERRCGSDRNDPYDTW